MGNVDIRRQLATSSTLLAEEAEAIRKWLIVAATPEVLPMLDDMAAEIENARARLAYWTGQPLRARLARLAWRARCMVGHSFEFDLGHRAPPAGTLGGQRAEVRASGQRRKFKTSPGETRDVLVNLAEATWFGVYAVERGGALIVLAPGSIRHAAGDRIEAGGVVLDTDDVSLDVFAVFDPQGTPSYGAAKCERGMVGRVARSGGGREPRRAVGALDHARGHGGRVRRRS